jgi:triosephosphate isomerase
MRIKIVAGNWKMNKTLNEGLHLANNIVTQLGSKELGNNLIILGTPFIHLAAVKEVIKENGGIKLAAQNCHDQESGAYTGEISASMLNSIGVDYVIIGHSERRQYFNETDEIIGGKIRQVLEHQMRPIFCCGEVLEQRQSDKHFEVIKSQISTALFGLSSDDFGKIVVAYEPVWAIGTGVTASKEQAQEMHHFIRSLIAEKYSEEISENTSILYGGSCKPSNVTELFSQPDVDGGLIGGASLTAEDFIGIVAAM